MTKNLKTLVSELPEIYQTIFGHPEWDATLLAIVINVSI